MHLSELKIARFRSCNELTVKFQRELTVLVGENNGGKSNIIDAIRLLTSPLNGRRDRYPEDDDLRRGADPTSFEVEGRFRGLSPALKGLLISAVPDPREDLAVFGLRYEPSSTGQKRSRATMWAGRFNTAEPEPGASGLIRHVYLPALRDAQQALGSGGATRVMSLFRHFLAKEDEEAFLAAVRRAQARPETLNRMNSDIGTALTQLTAGVRGQEARLDFSEEALIDIARDLRFKLADAGLDLQDIRGSGLGYANLLYVATVAVELTKAREADLTLFLVEEPEAHLHPQLQMLVLQFLLDRARASYEAQLAPGDPEGRIQVIVTTHSPNLTAWVSPSHLAVIRSVRPPEGAPHTRCVPICDLQIGAKTLGKVGRYLDVTRSALLFGPRALLVEGVAEGLLLPVLAEHIVLRHDREALSRFKGAVIAPIDGVDFKPYLEVLLKPVADVRIADRVIVITDADPTVPGNRKDELEALAERFNAAAALQVFTNDRTLEKALFVGNEAVMKEAFLALRPNSAERWDADIAALPEGERPDAFVELIDGTNTRKGDLAQEIASLIVDEMPFVVPDYLADAIRAVSAP